MNDRNLNSTWFVSFATTTGQLAQWPPSNTTWFVLYATTTGQLAQIWRTMKNRPRPGWHTRSRNGTRLPQASISSYEILQQHWETTYRENNSSYEILQQHVRSSYEILQQHVRQHPMFDVREEDRILCHTRQNPFAQQECDVIAARPIQSPKNPQSFC